MKARKVEGIVLAEGIIIDEEELKSPFADIYQDRIVLVSDLPEAGYPDDPHPIRTVMIDGKQHKGLLYR